MKRVTPLFVFLGSFFLLSSAAAANLTVKINKIGFEVDKAEIFAVNCVLKAQESKEVDQGCIEANRLLHQLNKKLDKVSVHVDNTDEVAKNIERLREKLTQVDNHLNVAKSITGEFPTGESYWTYSILPKIKPH